MQDKVEKVKRVNADKREKGERVIVRMTSKDTKRKILENKWRRKSTDVWIKHLTWEKKRIR